MCYLGQKNFTDFYILPTCLKMKRLIDEILNRLNDTTATTILRLSKIGNFTVSAKRSLVI